LGSKLVLSGFGVFLALLTSLLEIPDAQFVVDLLVDSFDSRVRCVRSDVLPQSNIKDLVRSIALSGSDVDLSSQIVPLEVLKERIRSQWYAFLTISRGLPVMSTTGSLLATIR
jgi:predicted ester cyclase